MKDTAAVRQEIEKLDTRNPEQAGKMLRELRRANEDNCYYNYADWLTKMMDKKKIKAPFFVSRGLDLDSNYLNKLKNGTKENPGRDVALRIAFGLGLNEEEINRSLKLAGHSILYPKSTIGSPDPVLIKGLQSHWSIEEIDRALEAYGNKFRLKKHA